MQDSSKIHSRKIHTRTTAHTYSMMDWSGDDLGNAISMFRQKMALYLEDEQIISSDAQARKICRGTGDEGLRQLKGNRNNKCNQRLKSII